MRWRRAHILLLSTIALGLYVVADLSLVEMLGQHPLQSEISMVDRHLRDIEDEQIKVQQKKTKDKPEETVEDKAFLREMLVYGFSGGVVLLAPIVLLVVLRHRKNGVAFFPAEELKPSEPYVFRWPRPSWSVVFVLTSLLLVGTGGLYIYEGHQGQGQLRGVMIEVGLREKQRRVRDEKERVKEEVVKGIMVRDVDRKQKGFIFSILGSLLLVGTIVSGLGRRPQV